MGLSCDVYDVNLEEIGSEGRIDLCEGAIIPSGVFEEIQTQGTIDLLSVHMTSLLAREKEVTNLLKSKKWVCFLVGGVKDQFRSYGGPKVVNDSDLCKRLMNHFKVSRSLLRMGDAGVRHTANEFEEFISRYGVAKTILSVRGGTDHKVIATCPSGDVGLAFGTSLFFLPFHSNSFSLEVLQEVINCVCNSILAYREKNSLNLPDWLSEFQFQRESRLALELQTLRTQVQERETEVQAILSWKGILTNSGTVLVDQVVSILQEFFALNVERTEKFIEDLTIVGDDPKKVLVAGEVKGTRSNVKREHINQVDAHRERLGLDPTTPGVLFINAEMDIETVAARAQREVAKEQVKLAKIQNVTVLRTIDLLNFMKLHESLPPKDRGKLLLQEVAKGGGWLKVDASTANLL